MLRQYNLYEIAPPVSQAPPVASTAETLSSNPVDQNNNQTEIDLAIGTVNKSSETQTNSAQISPTPHQKMWLGPKPSIQQKLSALQHQFLSTILASANMVRKEGSIEVWQYQFGSCVVDFFFYPVDEGASQLILKTWDMRSTIMGSSS